MSAEATVTVKIEASEIIATLRAIRAQLVDDELPVVSDYEIGRRAGAIEAVDIVIKRLSDGAA